MVEEGKIPQVTKEEHVTERYMLMLKRAQEEVGSLQWLALKTRPDIATITAVCASIQTKNPGQASMWTTEIWKYLNYTAGLGMNLVPEKAEAMVRIAADASITPGGERTRVGVVIRVENAIVHWSSNKQQGCTKSAEEAEITGAVLGTKVGISIRNVVSEMCEERVSLKLDQDNKGMISTIYNEGTAWRTRHYAVKAAGIRDLIADEEIILEDKRGIDIIAEPLTKVLPQDKLVESYTKLQLKLGSGETFEEQGGGGKTTSP